MSSYMHLTTVGSNLTIAFLKKKWQVGGKQEMRNPQNDCDSNIPNGFFYFCFFFPQNPTSLLGTDLDYNSHFNCTFNTFHLKTRLKTSAPHVSPAIIHPD